MEQTSIEARIIALEAQLRIYSHLKKGDIRLKGETSETVWEENPERILQGFSKPWVATARNPPDS